MPVALPTVTYLVSTPPRPFIRPPPPRLGSRGGGRGWDALPSRHESTVSGYAELQKHLGSTGEASMMAVNAAKMFRSSWGAAWAAAACTRHETRYPSLEGPCTVFWTRADETTPFIVWSTS